MTRFYIEYLYSNMRTGKVVSMLKGIQVLFSPEQQKTDRREITVKKIVYGVMTVLWLSTASLACAAADAPPVPAVAAAAAGTNMAAEYPSAKAKLPPLPVPPSSMEDAKATAAYIAAVDAYLKAAQSYIDAATSDANKVIQERNAAIESANQAAAQYNAFFKLDAKK